MKHIFNIDLYLADQLKENKDLRHTDDYKKLVNSTLEHYSWQRRSCGKEVFFNRNYNIGYLVLDGAIIMIKREWCSILGD